MKFLASVLFVILILPSTASGQNFRAQVKKLGAEASAAHKNGKLTALEYDKLKKEHQTIIVAIEKAMVDGVMTPDEKNKINSKIIRSKKRMIKYKNNREVY